MARVAVPAWNGRGVLPPNDISDPAAAYRSPYRVSLVSLVTRFANTAPRQGILQGLLDYRAALHDMGLTRGFQWLNGSFTEHVELIEQRPPNDIDMVNFVEPPENFQPSHDQLRVLDHDHAKINYRVDSYFVELNRLPTHELVRHSAYWYSMWSHRRNEEWKGFLELDLAPNDDGEAAAILTQYTQETGGTS